MRWFGVIRDRVLLKCASSIASMILFFDIAKINDGHSIKTIFDYLILHQLSKEVSMTLIRHQQGLDLEIQKEVKFQRIGGITFQTAGKCQKRNASATQPKSP